MTNEATTSTKDEAVKSIAPIQHAQPPLCSVSETASGIP